MMSDKRCPLAYAGLLADTGSIDSYGLTACKQEACAWWSNDAGSCGMVPVFTRLQAVEQNSEVALSDPGNCLGCVYTYLDSDLAPCRTCTRLADTPKRDHYRREGDDAE